LGFGKNRLPKTWHPKPEICSDLPQFRSDPFQAPFCTLSLTEAKALETESLGETTSSTSGQRRWQKEQEMMESRKVQQASQPKPYSHDVRGGGMKKLTVKRFFVVLLGVLVLFLAACDKSAPVTPETPNETPNEQPSFSLSMPKSSLDLFQGDSDELIIKVGRKGGFKDEVEFSLNAPSGISGSFSEAGTDQMKLELSISDSMEPGDYDLVVIASSGTLNQTSNLSLSVQTSSPTTPATPATITVVGKVTNVSGTGLNGLNVRVVDADGAFQETATDASGNFTVSNIKTPYSVSVVPPLGSISGFPQTWQNLKRDNPKLVVSFLGWSTMPACPVRSATVFGDLKSAGIHTIPVGHTAKAIYVAKGITNALSFPPFAVTTAPLGSAAQDLLLPGDNSYSINFTFDTNMCLTSTRGALIYLERDGLGNYVKSAIINNFELVTGDNREQDLNLTSAVVNKLEGEITFPDSVPGAFIGAILKVGDASVYLEDFTYALAVAGKKEYAFDIPVLSGVQYRTGAYSANAAFTQISFVYSDVLSAGDTGVNLSLPIVGGPVSPSGNISTITPTFNQRFISGMNVYYNFVTDGSDTYWFGTSDTNNMKFPAELPEPAQLETGHSYDWYGFTAIKIRNGAGVNDLVDGRLVNGAYAQLSAWLNPDGVEMGMVNLESKTFNINP
jgi:hypothetical protein